ncbi:NTP transferase domain-containing protein [Erythrobacter sp. KY5]|uniref:nucleotidyltransferase family protein n=1 Tax=Erythrobacter sp. KY5 TaxID=2011159 RepID=UPI0013A6AE6F|nr:nucleotidyltransferase family protein [Erythrobacter sp. KY5]
MADAPRLGVALLAAGSSRRFGSGDKLAAIFRGRRLGDHAALAIPVEEFAVSWVITSRIGHACEQVWQDCGLKPIVNPRASEGMGTSVACAARMAEAEELDGLIIALADMPMVPKGHFMALIGALCGPQAIAVSAYHTLRSPPAAFGKDHFSALASREGDIGARDLLSRGEAILCPPNWLVDIDTTEALKSLD